MSFTKALFAAVLLSTASSEAVERHDESRNRIWRLTRTGVVVHDVGRTVRVPLPDWIYAGPPFGCTPDLAIGPKGEALVSSDVVPVLWRVDPQTFRVTRHDVSISPDGEVGFVGLAWSAKENAWLAESTGDGATWRIDAQLKTARKLSGSNLPASCRYRAAAGGSARAWSQRSQPW